MRVLVAAVVALALPACAAESSGPVGQNCSANLPTYALGTTINGELTASDCQGTDGREDNFQFTVSSQTSVKASLSGTGKEIEIQTAGGETVYSSGPGQNVYVVLAPGTYALQVFGANGTYTADLTASAFPTTCHAGTQVFLSRGVDISAAITSADCNNNGNMGELFQVQGTPGKPWTFSTTASMGLNIEVNRNGTLVGFHVNNNAGANSFTFNPSAPDVYNVAFVSVPTNTFGTFSLSAR